MGRELDFDRVCDEVKTLLQQKNSAYGTSVNETFEDYGLMAYAIRIQDKVNRLRTLIKNPDISEDDEKVEDTLRDLAGYSILAIAQLKASDRKSEFIRFAEDELDILLKNAQKEGEESYNMQKVFNEGILEVIKAFDKGEHSGFTAKLATQYIDRLLRYQPLTHLTLEPDEWMEVTEGVYQNVRASNVFKDKDKFDGKPYCLDGPNGKPVTLEEYPHAYLGNFEQAIETLEVDTNVQEA